MDPIHVAPPIGRSRLTLGLLALIALLLSTVAVVGGAPPSNAAGTGPCDIYASGGTPCVAAHSTTRALYGNYSGSLYQVRRASDNATQNIGPVSAGSYANSAAQDSFCAGTTCVITVIYDQSGRGNHLTQAPPGGFSGPAAGGYDKLAVATAAPVQVGGHKVYGVYVSPGTGYRNNNTNGIATGDQPEGMYAIFDGTHYNGGCCFDYGNAETNSLDNGNGTMEALYFGDATYWGSGSGSGPWIMADLENGLFSGVSTGYNGNDPSISHRFLTAVLKGEPNHWAIRGGNAQSGGLSTFYDGVRPNAPGYNPMKKEGAIILGIGGDNSVSGAGTFYEGVMTSGYPSNATEDAVQANITAAGYSTAPVNNPFTNGSAVSLQATTPGLTDYYVAHSTSDRTTSIVQVSSSSSSAVKASATWIPRAGLSNSSCVSFESADQSGKYLRHDGFQLYLDASDGSSLFNEDATFCPQTGLNGQGVSLAAAGYADHFIRHYDYTLYAAVNGGANTWDASNNFADDSSFVIASPWSGGGGGTTYVKLQNRATGLYLDGMGRTSNGAAVGQWSNSSSYNQQWRITSSGGYVRLQNRASGLYLDGMGRTSNGADLGQWGNSSSSNQQWTQTSAGNYVKFSNRATGLYVDGMGRTSNGDNAGQWSSSGSYNQQWLIVTP